jgi:CubicO group peptidase (beta-lactamase class C family)
MRVPRTFAASIALVIASAGSAQTAASPPRPELTEALRLLDAWVEARVAYEDIPGASVGVVLDQELVWSKGYGWSDVGARTPATPDTVYGICSISKLFTSIAVMMERDAGRLRLDDPVAAHLPHFTLDATMPGAPPVTVRDLLTHSGGVPREADRAYWAAPDFPFPTREEIAEGLARQRMLYPPERYFQYSNLGMALLGQVVERTSGQPYERYVESRILAPLKLEHTTTRLPEGERAGALATGYGARSRTGERVTMPRYDARGIAPAAGFASTVRDLGAFASWQFRVLGTGRDELLKASTLREMHRPHWVDPDWKTTWGLGFSVWRDGDTTYVSHGGSCPGYRTTLRLDPRRKLAVVVMLNAMGESPEAIATQAFTIVAPAVQGKDGARPAAPVADLERFTGLYASAWGEIAVVPWRGGLAALSLPSEKAMEALTRLKYIDGGVFRRIREDGDDLGEEVVFEADARGAVTGLVWHNNASRKLR